MEEAREDSVERSSFCSAADALHLVAETQQLAWKRNVRISFWGQNCFLMYFVCGSFISSRSCDQVLDLISDRKSLYEFVLLREPIERLFSISHGFVSRFRKSIIDIYSSRSGVIWMNSYYCQLISSSMSIMIKIQSSRELKFESIEMCLFPDLCE